MKIGIIGNGFVGKATQVLKCQEIDILCYDINPEMCSPLGITLQDLTENCPIIFISVPTPMDKNGECYLGILKSVIEELNSLNYNGFKVIRSTVPVGTSKKLGCFFMPEFLTETNYIHDFIHNKHWIFGYLNERKKEFKEIIMSLFKKSHTYKTIKYCNIHFLPTDEAEMVKLFRNCFLATKVSFCNEINEFCSLKKIDYEKIRELATMDERITPSHSNVPGKDGHYGFGGTCFPKDISNLRFEMEKEGMKSFVLSSVIERNEKVDRTEKDWLNDKGRASV